MYVNICNIRFHLSGIIPDFIEDFKCFGDYSHVQVVLRDSSLIAITGEIICSEGGILWTRDGTGWRIYICSGTKGVLASIQADEKWQNILLVKKEGESRGLFKSLFEIMFRTVLILHGGVVLHASAVLINNQGLLFSAESGGGKSTHTALWQEHFNGRIINGDRPAICSNGEIRVCGTPFCGTSGQYTNGYAPLKAVFFLRKSLENKLYGISIDQSLTHLMTRSYMPYFSSCLIDRCLDILSVIASRIPVYILECRADISAVKKVMACLDL